MSDCWTLVRDWYGEQGIDLPDWDRPTTPEEFNQNPMFDDCWREAGFYEVDIAEMQAGDAMLMAIDSNKLNHVGVYIGDQLVLHHLRGRLSSRDIVGNGSLRSAARFCAMERNLGSTVRWRNSLVSESS